MVQESEYQRRDRINHAAAVDIPCAFSFPVVWFWSCTKSSKVSCPEDNQGANFMTIRTSKREQDLEVRTSDGAEGIRVTITSIKRDGWDMRV